VVIVLRAFLVC